MTYKATRDGFIIGNHYAKDAEVPLTTAQAKYLTTPYGDAVYADTKQEFTAPAAKNVDPVADTPAKAK